MLLLLLYWVFNIAEAIIIIHVVLSWFPNARWSPFGRLIDALCDPMLRPIRRLVGPVALGNSASLDFSPFIALVLLNLLYQVLSRVLG